ncbi:peptidase family C50-domain-containing protein [Multifurca ochricompacta]|uniref:separase n=1 Tax=Multifurca ochricompacta TaxID=376703 RepID=A0AAD4M1V4_9AGAM|nr:peptidase family C50-domain-containing protein [Multifurca ochricompacta]
MATSAKARRPISAPEKRSTSKGKAAIDSAGKITHELAVTHSISKAQGPRKGTATEPSRTLESTQEKRTFAMRAVNSASQGLTTVIKSGWKALSPENSVKRSAKAVHEAFGMATSARVALEDLRSISPGDMDVERAGVSVAGKLLSLDMYSHALDVLSDMHGRLAVLAGSDPVLPISRRNFKTPSLLGDVTAVISLPLPSSSSTPMDTTLLLLILTYLSHVLIALSHCLDSASLKHSQLELLALFSRRLYDSPSLLRWIPLCTQLLAKQRDALLTRAYTALTSIPSKQLGSAESVFRIRIYALMCLLRTSSSTIGPMTFWDQVVKSASSFAKSASSKDKQEERRLCLVVTSLFSELLSLVEERENKDEFLHGIAFISFCDAWISFSKSADDVFALSKVIALVQSPPSAPLSDCDEEKLLRAVAKLSLEDDSQGEKRGDFSGHPSQKDGLCASLARATTLLSNLDRNDGVGEGVLNGIQETTGHVREARALASSEPREDYSQAVIRTRRALDKLKRVAIKVLDPTEYTQPLGDTIIKAVKELLLDIATTMEVMLSAGSAPDDYASLLDLFFVMARTTLAPNNPVLTDAAYNLLSRAARLLRPHTIDPLPSVSRETFANFVRCLSGAFHALGGTLYQAGKYGTAIRFLRHGCYVGSVALRLRESCDAVTPGDGQEPQKVGIAGACCSRLGAYDAFTESLSSYVFPHAVVELVRTIGPAGAFEVAPSLKRAAIIIDRITYMAACELLRLPTQEDRRCVVGAILERQVESLAGSLWKPDVQSVVAELLSDCVMTYDSGKRPIRRAGVMLRVMELAYCSGVVDTGLRLAESTEEVKALLSSEGVGLDSSLTHLRALHSAEMHLWLALHAHREVHPQQSTVIIQHARETCRILRTWIHGKPTETAEVKQSPHQVSVARKARGKTASARAVAATTRRPKTSKLIPATPKRTRKSDVLLKAKSPAVSKAEVDVMLTRKSTRRLISLINMVTHLVGFVGHVILKLELLQVARQFCKHPLIDQHEDFVQLSIQLAHEYVKFGKLREAGGVYKRSLNSTQIQTVSTETRILLHLRHAESLTKIGDVNQGIALYTEALQLSESLPTDGKETSTADRVYSHVNRLRRTALASSVFAEIKLSQDDPTSSLTGFLQAIRLWNRAVNMLCHLSSREGSGNGTPAPSNPFDVSPGSGKASPTKDENNSFPGSSSVLHSARTFTNGVEWQIAEGLLETTLSLARVYFRRGSVREAEYFMREAEQLASAINAPALLCRVLTMKVELELQLRQLDAALITLRTATASLDEITNLDVAELHKLCGERNELMLQDKDAQLQYAEALKKLEELDGLFSGLDAHTRRSSVTFSSPHNPARSLEPPAPALFSAVLRQHIWLLRNDIGDEYESLLQKLSHLAPLTDIQSEERSLLAKLTLHDVYDHFQEDMFLSSIRESVLSLPMGISGDKSLFMSTSAQVIMRTLTDAEKLFHSDLTSIAHRGSVPRVREAASSLALIRSFQSSLGGNDSSLLVANLLDTCANVTLRREILEVISYKTPSKTRDDFRWPLLTAGVERLGDSKARRKGTILFNSDDDTDEQSEDRLLTGYWESIRTKYQQLSFNLTSLAQSKVANLPANWTIVHIYVTEDQSTMFACRQRANQLPLVFSLPLKGRREAEDEHLTFEDAISELREIIRLSNESTKSAINVKGKDQSARATWWADRMALDKRLKELLESIEFCWFGAFKTILSEQVSVPEDAMSVFRGRIDRIFQQTIGAQGKKQSTRMHLDNSLLECFSRLSPKCRDEELEDLVYFILDLYQFHGVQVAIAEVDVDHVVIDFRMALEEHAARTRDRIISQEDEHVFLVLNKSLQEIPWESLPVLRGRSVSRIPNVDFLVDRLEFAQRRRRLGNQTSEQYNGRTRLDASSTYYVLNPSGDLDSTERRFSPWLRSMQEVGWDGIIGRAPSEQEFSHALEKNELLIYFGHGGGEQYIRSHKIRHLPQCAATMLWGCSSGLLRDMGEFDRIGTPYNYTLAGCPTLIANLWDVTDRDIDKLTQAVFDKMH